MHIIRRNDGVWISEAPIRSWVNGEPLSLTNRFVSVDEIPFISQLELETLSDAQKTALSELDLSPLYPLGIAFDGRNCYYLIFIWNAGYLFRKNAKLSSNPLFCSLLTDVSNTISPNIDQLLHPFDVRKYGAQVLDHLAFALLHSGRLDLAIQAAIALCEKTPETEKGWLRLGEISFKMELYKLAMLAYGKILHLPTAPQKLLAYCIERVTLCSMHTEWGHVFLEEEMKQIPTPLSSILLEPWALLREMLKDAHKGDRYPTLQRSRRIHVFAPVEGGSLVRLPSFFRWIVPFQVAVSSAPRYEAEVEQLYSLFVGIRHIISLDQHSVPNKAWLQGKSIKHTTIPIPDFYPPSIEQVDCIMELLVDPSNLPVLIHCTAGLGRTGTIIACYLTAFGFQVPGGDGQMPVMQASEAITALRAIRPGSIETAEQEDLISKWASEVWKRKSILRPAVQEPSPCALKLIGNVPVDADLFILVGLQGSGKSWFARALRARDPNRWKRVSQDESGSRSTSETEIGRDPHGKRVILDRCNPTSKDRAHWINLAHWAKHPVLVWFDYPADLCEGRAQRRFDHPTLHPGSRVRTAIHSTAAQFEAPPSNLTKERSAGLAIIRSFSACLELVALLSPPIQIYKFPRTAHLLNLGAATDDDLHHTTTTDSHNPPSIALEEGSRLVITEKIDGANLGVSLDADSRIVVQNRSHWVNSKTHFQFKRLDLWVEENREGLHRILARDDAFAQRYILFGEWLVCVHSIHYTRLPNQFLAFDLYDRSTSTFASRDVMESILDGTGIYMVPTLETRQSHPGVRLTMPSDDKLRSMVQRSSNFYNGRVEGVYLKVEKDGKVTGRGKVVRGDFIAGNEHWTRGNLTLNGIVMESIVSFLSGNAMVSHSRRSLPCCGMGAPAHFLDPSELSAAAEIQIGHHIVQRFIDGDGEECTNDKEEEKVLMQSVATQTIVLLKDEKNTLPLSTSSIRNSLSLVGMPNRMFSLVGAPPPSNRPILSIHLKESQLLWAQTQRFFTLKEYKPSRLCLDLKGRATAYGSMEFDSAWFSHDDKDKPLPGAVETGIVDISTLFIAHSTPAMLTPKWTLKLRGTIKPRKDTLYQFRCLTTGRSKVYGDGNLVVDNWTVQRYGKSFFRAGTEEERGQYTLKKGVEFLIEFNNVRGPQRGEHFSGTITDLRSSLVLRLSNVRHEGTRIKE